MPTLVSTMGDPVEYTLYENAHSDGGNNPVTKTVHIRGGAGVASRHRILEGEVQTSQAIVTKVSDEDYEALKRNSVFQTHVDNGFIKVLLGESSGTKKEAKAASADMSHDDEAKQYTPKDFEKGGRASKHGVNAKLK